MHNILLTILTCDKRKKVLKHTLKSIAESDWPGKPIVKKDKEYTSAVDTPHRIDEAARGILEYFITTDFDYLLYMEDDVIVNKHLYHNITTSGSVDYMTLCNWGSGRTGGQGMLLSRKAVELVLAETWRAPFDQMIRSILEEKGITIHYHQPSLVQHDLSSESTVDDESAQGYAIDFEPDYKRNIV